MVRLTGRLSLGCLLLVVGCRSAGLGVSDRETVDGAAAPIQCTTGGQLLFDGAPQSPTAIVGNGTPELQCCNELGSVAFVLPSHSGTVPELRLTIARYLGNPLVTPLRVELAPLPKEWSLSLRYSECLGTGSNPCQQGADQIDELNSRVDTFTGAFDVAGAEGARRVSLCIDALAMGAEHPLLQSAHLIADDVELPRSF